MVKPLSFKGDKKTKKRKRPEADQPQTDDQEPSAGAVVKANEEVDDDDSWVSADVPSDISGPVMIVLPSEKPTALACDAAGKIFTLPIVNIVDDNPASAEPNDVRQVWVVNRVAGTEHFRLKGSHGKYLSCDKIGALSATQGAISPLECFNIIATPDTPGTFQIQSTHETYLTIAEPKSSATKSSAAVQVRGDADSVAFNTTFRVRMQARYKPRIKTSKEEKALAKISRKELEETVGRRLDENEVRILKKARREGNYHETLLDFKTKSKHDKFS